MKSPAQLPILFCTREYRYIHDELMAPGTFISGEIDIKVFPDGETYHRILNDVVDQDVILIGGTIDDSNTLELYDLAQGLAHAGSRSLKIIIPYFGYSTMERAVQRGEIAKAKNRALLFSSLPVCAEANHVYLMDLHSEGIPYYFEREIRCTHLYCKKLIMEVASNAFGTDFVLAATDAGRAKWVESLSNEMGVKSAFVYKHRISGSETAITGVNADVKDRNVIIYDDMIRTGGSLMQAAKAYHEAGAKQIICITSHGLFNQDALTKIEAQGLIEKVICTNTHPLALQQTSKLLEVKSVASIIFEALNPDL